MARGFDFYDDAFSAETFQQKDIGLVDRKAGESVTHALSWLKKTPRRPFFLWLHLYDPHSPYDPPEPYRTQYRSHLYDGEIAYADHELGRLISWLKRSQLYDRSLIVLLSDHGESLGDHGEKEHGFFVYNATVHVPLIVKPPATSSFRSSRVPRPVETIDIAPTLLELMGLPKPTVEAVPDALRQLTKFPELFRIVEPHLFRRATAIPNDPNCSLEWQLQNISAERAWDIQRGSVANRRARSIPSSGGRP